MYEMSLLHPHGVFLRQEALAAGHSDKTLYGALRAGSITRVRHGSYVATSQWDAADPYERYRLQCHAALLRHDENVALSHTSAAIMHGLDVWGADLSRVHLIRLDDQNTRRCSDVRYHCGHVPDDHLTRLKAGGWATTPVRAALEHATVNSVESGTCTLNSYLHREGLSGLDKVKDAYSQMAGFPGNRRLHITLRLIRPGVESVGESRVVFLCWEHHLPSPTHQHHIYDPYGHLIGRTDFAWLDHNLLGEFDGKAKYEQYLLPGETPADALFREKRREDLIREISGYNMIRFTWRDLELRERTAARLHRMLVRR